MFDICVAYVICLWVLLLGFGSQMLCGAGKGYRGDQSTMSTVGVRRRVHVWPAWPPRPEDFWEMLVDKL